MRINNKNGALSVRAICSPQVVILAWDILESEWETFTDGLLGFAIERSEFRGGTIYERYFLRGIKRFKDKDEGLIPGTPVPTSEHPVQSFQWGDYDVDPEKQYQYRIIPVYGKSKLLELRVNNAVEVELITPKEHIGDHAVYFNRAAAGSQAYSRHFPGVKPDESQPLSPQMMWLSRGLYEALISFINQADSSKFALRAAFYEFRYLPVGQAFKKAAVSGVDVKVLYDKVTYGEENMEMVTKAGIQELCRERSGVKSNKHNKFIILLKDELPVAVWTGSTNISAGGIFGHSNVGHIVYNAAIAKQYLDYWTFLWDTPDILNAPLKKRNNKATPTPKEGIAQNSITVLFSPREAATLDWYAECLQRATEIACFTVAFTISQPFAEVLKKDSDALRYVLKDKASEGDDLICVDEDVILAAGAKFEKRDLANFQAEVLTGFNRNNYIHDKFLLIDPLSDDPIVITGSANFSSGSNEDNDENMLIIRGNTDLADIYFGEFMRLFNHLYSRHIITRILPNDTKQQKRNYLYEDNSWVTSNRKGTKAKRRQRFHGPWA